LIGTNAGSRSRSFIGFQDFGGKSKKLGRALELPAERMFDLWHRVRDGTPNLGDLVGERTRCRGAERRPWDSCIADRRGASVLPTRLRAPPHRDHQDRRIVIGPGSDLGDHAGVITPSGIRKLVVRRYERGSMLVTTNQSVTQWGQVFGDEMIAAAILDRLLHHNHTLLIQCESYRLKQKKRAGLIGSTQRS
jgi:hypothetical protein